MGQDPNQPYSGPYGQPQPGGGEYYQGYSQQPQQPYQQPQQPPYQQPYQQPAPGYQQPAPGYQQPGGQGSYNTANPLGPTTINMEPNVAGGLSYFTWIAGLIFFLIEKQNRFVRFNAMQCLVLTGAYIIAQFAVSIVFGILGAISFVFAIVTAPLSGLIGIAAFVIWIICVINAFQGKYFKIPFIGDYAERWSGGSGMGAPMR